MSKLETLQKELEELYQFESTITERVWNESKDAVDLQDTALTETNIKDRVALLAKQLVVDFADTNPVIVGLMDGAVPFAALLNEVLIKLNFKFNYTTMSVSSYGNEMNSGSLKKGALPKVDLMGRTVIILDDVCDTGKTLKAIRDDFLLQYPKALKTMVLVDKVQERRDGCDPDYAGFKLSKDAFIIGMGLDYRKDLRNKMSIKAANFAALPNAQEQAHLDRIEVVKAEIKAEILSLKKESAQLVTPRQDSFFSAVNDKDKVTANPSTNTQSATL